ncbi:hypothetical protein BBK82_43955 [Lentzea guizhouensis]|uniref:Uncharacterized protein n=1 Tax=Lentzea guizhouensis TaxID=1586287 RepID=A0A1B2HVT7_9PSEU|nr:hypothetical protein [Lentzea guizhouensis]ANZ41860.1 hypothetical protein BBK82_43955 [Lentzea guizhouensis]
MTSRHSGGEAHTTRGTRLLRVGRASTYRGGRRAPQGRGRGRDSDVAMVTTVDSPVPESMVVDVEEGLAAVRR